jgi:hypothetical protein
MSKRKARTTRHQVRTKLSGFVNHGVVVPRGSMSSATVTVLPTYHRPPAKTKYGSAPNRDVMSEYALRATQLGGPEVPPTALMQLAHRQPSLTTRDEIKLLWQSAFRQGVDKFNHITLEKSRFGKLDMWFTGEIFFFVEEKFDRYRRMSIPYGGRERAMQMYGEGRIAYIERQDLHGETV